MYRWFCSFSFVYLPTAHYVALKSPFPFRQTQIVLVFPLKHAPFCKLSAGLGSTNKSAISLLFLFDFLSVLAVLSSPPFILLPQSLWQIWQELSSLSYFTIRPQWVLGHLPLLGNDKLARRVALLVPSSTSCGISPLISRIHFCLFLGLKAYCLIEILRQTNFIGFLRGTCAPSPRSQCALSPSLQRTQSSVNFLSLWNGQNRESFMQCLRTHFREFLSSHSPLSSNILFAPLALW